MLKKGIVTFEIASLLMVTGYGCSDDSGSSEQDQIIDNPQHASNACNGKNEGEVCGAGGSCFEEVCLSNICTKRPLSQGTECRASAGVCDAAEVCDGQNTDCPEDIKKSKETVCRESAGECDIAEVCDGENTDCPEDIKKSSETVCRESVGECDITEYCDGKSDTCPDDVCEENCKSSDPPPVKDPLCEGKIEGDVCGTGKECSQMICLSGICTEKPLPEGTECRAAAGDCDEAEVCDGSSFTCPDDGIKPSGSVCRPSIGGCDLPESCDGETKDCPIKDEFDENCACPENDTTLGIKDDSAPRAIEGYQYFILKDQNTWDEKEKAIDSFGKDKIVTMVNLSFKFDMTTTSNKFSEKAWSWSNNDKDDSDWAPQGLAGTTKNGIVYRLVSWSGGEDSKFLDWGRIAVVKFGENYQSVKYTHALLVELNDDKTNYHFAPTHAGGLAISGDYLYVSSSGKSGIVPDGERGMRVFDLRRFVKADTSKDCQKKVGIVNGKMCAHGYPYMLVQVGAYYYPDTQPAKCRPTISFISMDYVDNEHTILSGEFRKKTHEYRQYSRLVRWTIDQKTHRLVTDDNGVVTAAAAWYTGIGGVQGASSHTDTEKGTTTFYLNGFHNYSSTITDGLIVADVDAPKSTKYLYKSKNPEWGYAPQGMYITTTNRIWTVCEKKGNNRILFYANRNDVTP